MSYPVEPECDPGICPVCQDECLNYAEDIAFPLWRGVYRVYRCEFGHVTGWFEGFESYHVERPQTDDELVSRFEGVMIPVNDPFAGDYRVPGWRCKTCGWRVGSIGYPPGHTCPDEGHRQSLAHLSRVLI